MGTRRLAREIGLQLLYEMEMKQAEPRSILSLFWKKDPKNDYDQEILDDTKEYATELVEGVYRNIKEIDHVIEKHAHHWKLARMAVVDRNILRLGAYELLYQHAVPVSVVLDEAVEISKKFGTAESSAFVNGILDHVAKEVRK
ncbi:MAG: transcription antitermination factor NusB [Deltaproteobacteria bacterium]|nr:MAG: transcription antitermination factor NusB [Deltaproteobacteria bacterium]